MQTHHSVLQKAMEEGSNRVGKEPQPTKRERKYSSRVSHTSLYSRSRPAREGEKEQRKSSQKTLAL